MHRTSIVPKATTNLEKAKSDIDEYGYCLIENALEPAVVDAALSRLKEQAAAELQLGAAFEDGGPKQQWGAFTDGKGRPRQQAYTAEAGGINQRVWMLVNKGRIFRQILFTKARTRCRRPCSGRRLPPVQLLSQYRQAGRRRHESAYRSMVDAPPHLSRAFTCTGGLNFSPALQSGGRRSSADDCTLCMRQCNVDA